MFDLYNGKVRLLKSEIDVPEIKELIEGIPTEDAVAVVLFIFLMYDRTNDNPLYNLPNEERRPEAVRASGIDFTKYDDILLSKACNAYSKKHHDDIQEDIDVYDHKLFQFIEMLNELDPEIIKNTHELSGRVSFSTNVDIITTVLDNSLNIIVDKSVLTDMKESGKYNQKLRGTLSKRVQKKLLNKIKDDDTV